MEFKLVLNRMLPSILTPPPPLDIDTHVHIFWYKCKFMYKRCNEKWYNIFQWCFVHFFKNLFQISNSFKCYIILYISSRVSVIPGMPERTRIHHSAYEHTTSVELITRYRLLKTRKNLQSSCLLSPS